MNRRTCPALLVSAPASNHGKTTITAALARFHRDRGRNVRVFKTGPDFLDPMIIATSPRTPPSRRRCSCLEIFVAEEGFILAINSLHKL